jgi:hypothetical protein
MSSLIERIRERVADPLSAVDAAAWVRPMPRVVPPASPEEVAAAEVSLGFELPPLLRRLYLEVGNSSRSLANTGLELSRPRPSSGMFPASCPETCGVSPHRPTAPEHRFRESSQVAAHDRFTRTGPSSSPRTRDTHPMRECHATQDFHSD